MGRRAWTRLRWRQPLYANADQAGKKALTILTISNCILTGEEMDVDIRERALNDMITVGLETAWNYAV